MSRCRGGRGSLIAPDQNLGGRSSSRQASIQRIFSRPISEKQTRERAASALACSMIISDGAVNVLNRFHLLRNFHEKSVQAVWSPCVP